MTRTQRIGLAILLCVLILASLMASKPDITLKSWKGLHILSGITAGLGTFMFIKK